MGLLFVYRAVNQKDDIHPFNFVTHCLALILDKC